MNILLIYPEMPRTIGKFEHMANLAGRKSAFPPIGLLTVAAMLPNEWNKKVVDLNTDPLTEEDLNWADYAFISAMNVQAKSSKEVVEICNKANLPVVAGGPLFTHEYEKFPGVSHFILNEAELTLPPFLNDLKMEKQKEYTHRKNLQIHIQHHRLCGSWLMLISTCTLLFSIHAVVRTYVIFVM
jgi:hypothetical protein